MHVNANNMADTNTSIVRYFHERLSYCQIKDVMLNSHDVSISIRQIHRILRKLNLRRRKYCEITTVIDFIMKELEQCGGFHGYRMQRQRCMANGLNVRMRDVRTILQICDPEGVKLRTARKFIRRTYFAAGPNFIWHIDGYDKLKPYGLCIHGCICGYSRKIMWLNVYTTNNDPKVIAGYFIETVKRYGGTASMIRCDFGTENVLVRDIQTWFRRHGDSSNSYIEGASTQNQRIESWWGYLRRQHIQHWIELFKNIQESGEYSASHLDKCLIQFCFMGLIQAELDLAVSMWNGHSVRPSRNSIAPYGKPNIMFNYPELLGSRNYMCNVHQDDINVAETQVTFRSPVCCDLDMYDAFISVLAEDNLQYPNNKDEALAVYAHLRTRLM